MLHTAHVFWGSLIVEMPGEFSHCQSAVQEASCSFLLIFLLFKSAKELLMRMLFHAQMILMERPFFPTASYLPNLMEPACSPGGISSGGLRLQQVWRDRSKQVYLYQNDILVCPHPLGLCFIIEW